MAREYLGIDKEKTAAACMQKGHNSSRQLNEEAALSGVQQVHSGNFWLNQIKCPMHIGSSPQDPKPGSGSGDTEACTNGANPGFNSLQPPSSIVITS